MESKIIICRIYHWDHESYDASYQIIDGYKFIVNKEESYCDIWKLDSYETNCEQAELLEKYFVEENFEALERLLKDAFSIRFPKVDKIEWLDLLKRN